MCKKQIHQSFITDVTKLTIKGSKNNCLTAMAVALTAQAIYLIHEEKEYKNKEEYINILKEHFEDCVKIAANLYDLDEKN